MRHQVQVRKKQWHRCQQEKVLAYGSRLSFLSVGHSIRISGHQQAIAHAWILAATNLITNIRRQIWLQMETFIKPSFFKSTVSGIRDDFLTTVSSCAAAQRERSHLPLDQHWQSERQPVFLSQQKQTYRYHTIHTYATNKKWWRVKWNYMRPSCPLYVESEELTECVSFNHFQIKFMHNATRRQSNGWRF